MALSGRVSLIAGRSGGAGAIGLASGVAVGVSLTAGARSGCAIGCALRPAISAALRTAAATPLRERFGGPLGEGFGVVLVYVTGEPDTVAPSVSVIEIARTPSVDGVCVKVCELEPDAKTWLDELKVPPLSLAGLTVSEPDKEVAVTVECVEAEPVVPDDGPESASVPPSSSVIDAVAVWVGRSADVHVATSLVPDAGAL